MSENKNFALNVLAIVFRGPGAFIFVTVTTAILGIVAVIYLPPTRLTGDWLVVQYTPDGSVANSWELKQKEVVSWKGIHFSIENNHVDLVKDYTFLQVTNNKWDDAKKRLLQK